MLAADKAALETELKRKALEIQDKELNFFVTNFGSIATQGALLGGFSFSALTLTSFKGLEANNVSFKIAYYACTTLAMSFQLVAVLMSTLCNMWGPGLALRGPEGSMKTAVDGMKIEQEWAIRFFALGVFFFHMSSLCYAWVAFSEGAVAEVVTVILLVFLVGRWRLVLSRASTYSLAHSLLCLLLAPPSPGDVLRGGHPHPQQVQAQEDGERRLRRGRRAARGAQAHRGAEEVVAAVVVVLGAGGWGVGGGGARTSLHRMYLHLFLHCLSCIVVGIDGHNELLT
jgi:hypothetical protein